MPRGVVCPQRVGRFVRRPGASSNTPTNARPTVVGCTSPGRRSRGNTPAPGAARCRLRDVRGGHALGVGHGHAIVEHRDHGGYRACNVHITRVFGGSPGNRRSLLAYRESAARWFAGNRTALTKETSLRDTTKEPHQAWCGSFTQWSSASDHRKLTLRALRMRIRATPENRWPTTPRLRVPEPLPARTRCPH